MQLESEFRQRILAGSRGPVDPGLYTQIFDNEPEVEGLDEEGIFYPTSEEDFEMMMAQWDEQGVEMSEATPTIPTTTAAALAESLGFAMPED